MMTVEIIVNAMKKKTNPGLNIFFSLERIQDQLKVLD